MRKIRLNNKSYPGSLHNHTDFSNLRLRDSINKVSSLIDYAIELGHSVVAFTEHETVSNAIKIEKYYNKIKKNSTDWKFNCKFSLSFSRSLFSRLI